MQNMYCLTKAMTTSKTVKSMVVTYYRCYNIWFLRPNFVTEPPKKLQN